MAFHSEHLRDWDVRHRIVRGSFSLRCASASLITHLRNSLPQFSPTLRDEFGLPRLFMTRGISAVTALQYRLVTMLFVTVSFLGLFRIPKNAPSCRKLFFSSVSWACFATWTFGDSNLTGKLSGFTFDAWTWWGKLAILGAHTGALVTTLKLLDDAIAGPEKGRDTIPLIGERWVAFLLATGIFLFAYTFYYPILCMFGSKAAFQQSAAPFYALGYQDLSLVNSMAVNAFTAFGALFATLRLERRISARTGNLLNWLCFFLFQYDPLKLVLWRPDSVDPAIMQTMNSFTGGLARKFGLQPIFGTLYLGTIVNAFWRRWRSRKGKDVKVNGSH